MDAAASAVLEVGAGALQALNQFLEDTDTARCWYGSDYGYFTTWSWRMLLPPFRKRKINNIFGVHADDWEQLIRNCLLNHKEWIHAAQSSDTGECSWLPLYRALPGEKRHDWREKAQQSSSYIGAVRSRPAARFDVWGLVVLAFANGAGLDITHGSNGGFFAEMSARDFVVTVWQHDLSGSMIGHIEPRNQASEQHMIMTDSEWQNLLYHGHSFKEDHHVFGWPSNGDTQHQPPKNLTTDHHDSELKHLIIDYQMVKRLQKHLLGALRQCYEFWDACDYKISEEEGHPKEATRQKICDIRRHLTSFKKFLSMKLSPCHQEYPSRGMMHSTTLPETCMFWMA
ncbi:uncharacterized protein F5Z01DRAFT_697879 [Emericellopsis atlantica]|uniref:Uncharacterized protein n=1 Tax=Emericellopsis atlantica TaxID=2614577 RepID=A0A9P8CJG5_9HYPO|nr:uncharacterized protein F5Z01DRAFT_697879 [Emericellopsis atlantica]KAG9249449.1 hypothetical protein F5Z01DRAFT_697879 [Emericellopsis atlantica]